MPKNPPLILAIDTSCDDTSAAITQGVTVLSNVIASQTELHAQYGGVHPSLAKKAHRENIEPTVRAALKKARVKIGEISAIAVTQGPGLAPSLEVGIKFAQELAKEHKLSLLAINHLEGHLLSPLAKRSSRLKKSQSWNEQKLSLPALGIIVSGGHTEFILIKRIGQYQRLGWTIDDAVGEALDKVGRLLGLGYPAGPVIEKLAKSGDAKRFDAPLPMIDREDFTMSFSGLKTWARNKLEDFGGPEALSRTDIYDFTASFQRAVFRHICYKLSKLLFEVKIESVWLGGGVAANLQLRRMIRETLKTYSRENQSPSIPLLTPYCKRLCMDNAAMIGVVAGSRLVKEKQVKITQQLDRKPRWSLGT